MKGDFSRVSFRREKHYSRVLMQQGRVQLDADWNEQMAILAHQNDVQMADIVGVSGVPAGSHGFHLYLRPGLDFTHGGACVSVESPHAFAFSGGAPFTIEAWIRPRSQGLVVANSGADVSGGYALLIDSDLKVRFERDVSPAHDVPPQRFHIETIRKLPTGEYSHVAVTFDGEVICIYISGELAATAVCPGHPVSPDRSLSIGGRAGSAGFDGELADLRIWDICRSQSEIRNHRRGLSEGRHVHLVGWYRFEADTPFAADSSGHEHHALFVPIDSPRPTWRQTVWARQGRCYAEGVVCESAKDVTIALPAIDPAEQARTLIWLEVWEDFVNAIEDPGIREPALGGPDTSGRVQVRWAIRLLPLPEQSGNTRKLKSSPVGLSYGTHSAARRI